MFSVLRSMWIWAASVTLIVSWVPLMAAVWLFDRDPLRRPTARFFRQLGRVLARINPWRVHIAGSEKIRPGEVYVVVSNHQSLADIPVIAHLRIEAKWLAKAELFKVPLLGWMLRMAGDIPVQRKDRRKAAQALLQCARVLRQRCSMVCFPEGTRSRDGSLLPFNDGPFQLALREGISVLPLVVEGSGAALPRNTWMFGPALDIQLRVLDPVTVEGRDPKDAAALREEVRERIALELQRLRKGARP